MPRGKKRKLTTPPEDEKSSKKAKLNLLTYDPREEIILPDEILLQIFRDLERADILRCSITCRHWYRIGQRDEFHWFYLSCLRLEEFASGYHYLRNEKLKKFAELDIEQENEELKLWLSDPLHNGHPIRIESTKDNTYWLYDEHDELVAISVIYAHNPPFNFNNGRLWKYEIVDDFDKEEVLNLTELRQWIIRLHINLKVLDTMVVDQNTNRIPNIETLLAEVASDWQESTVMETVRRLGPLNFTNKPKISIPLITQPDAFKLLPHQLEAVTWMKSIEDKIGEDISYSTALRLKGSRVYFDTNKQKTVHPEDVGKYLRQEKIRGGILGSVTDDKIFEVIGLILTCPPQQNTELHPELINSRATLIMCRDCTTNHWYEEITRATELKVLLVFSMDDLKKCTYEDFISEYDVIILAYELLASNAYLSLPSPRAKTKGSLSLAERSLEVKKALANLRAQKNFDQVNRPIAEHFFFHRVVLTTAQLAEELSSYTSEYKGAKETYIMSRKIWGQRRWLVTPDPFAHRVRKSLPNFFQLNLKQNDDFQLDFIYRNLMWYADHFIHLQDKAEAHFIEMSAIERAVSFYNVESSDPYCAKTYCEGLKTVAEIYLKKIEFLLPTAIIKAKTMESNTNYKLKNTNHNNYHVKNLVESQIRVNTLQNIKEILKSELIKIDTKVNDEETEFTSIQLKLGTKVAHVFSYIKNLLQEEPNSRIVIFSMEHHSDIVLEHQNIEQLFNKYGILTASVRQEEVDNADEFIKNLEQFQVILMNTEKLTPLTNLVHATHVIVIDYPMHDLRVKDFDKPRICRAFIHGQDSQPTVVRFIFKDTREHALYAERNNEPYQPPDYNPETWKPTE